MVEITSYQILIAVASEDKQPVTSSTSPIRYHNDKSTTTTSTVNIPHNTLYSCTYTMYLVQPRAQSSSTELMGVASSLSLALAYVEDS